MQVRSEKDRNPTRMTGRDLIVAARLLIAPITGIGVLVFVARRFGGAGAAQSVDVRSNDGFAAVPQSAWVLALLLFLISVLPRKSSLVRIPGIAMPYRIVLLALGAFGLCAAWRFPTTLTPFTAAALCALLGIGSLLALAAIVRDQRLRDGDPGAVDRRVLEEMVIEYEQRNGHLVPDLALTHPQLFARIGALMHSRSPLGTRLWFLRPHPALGDQRPIDVLQQPDGEARLLRACELGPNA